MPFPQTKEQWISIGLPFIYSTSTAFLAYKIRDLSVNYRFSIGYSVLLMGIYNSLVKDTPAKQYSHWKQLLPKNLNNPYSSLWVLELHLTTSMILGSAMAGVFGGNKYFTKHGIDTYKKLLISSVCPGQCYFHPKSKQSQHNSKSQRYKSMIDLGKISLLFGSGYIISKYLSHNKWIKDFIESHSLLKYELMAFLLSIAVGTITNIPSAVIGIIFGGENNEYTFEVIKPYDNFVYFSKSMRDFWKNWSRPTGELLRYMVYNPLGGRNNTIISVLSLFAINCAALHYVWSYNIYGNAAYKTWNKGFALMAVGLSTQMVLENYLFYNNTHKESHGDNNMEKKAKSINKDNKIWQIFCFGLFHGTMLGTLSIIHEEAWICDVSSLCNTFLLDEKFS